MAELDIEERQIGGITVLELDGRVTIGETCIALRQTIRRVVEEGKKDVVLDLRGARYIDSSGIMELVASYMTVSRAGGILKLCHVTEKIKDLLSITKLLTVFDVYESVEEAARSFSGSTSTRVSCPVYGCGKLIVLADSLVEAKCASCGAKFTIAVEYQPLFELALTSLRLPTYEGEYITIFPGTPTRIMIEGRLDLFASETLERAWLTIPSPRVVIFQLEASSDISLTGAQKLVAFCAGGEKDSRAVILAPANVRAVFPPEFPIHDTEAHAIAALEMTSAGIWTMSIH